MVLVFLAVVLRIQKVIEQNLSTQKDNVIQIVNILVEQKKPLINLWRMLKIYIVVTLYVLWFTVHSFVFGSWIEEHRSPDTFPNVCNVITNNF